MDGDGVYIALGGGAVGALCSLGAAWIKARFSRTKVGPQPFETREVDKFVTRDEFKDHVQRNELAHENLFGRLNRNDKATAEINGKLTAIIDDLKMIKNFIMSGGKK